MVAVPNRTADVLLGVVREKIREGPTVISDCWSSYNLVRDDVWSFDKISTLSLERMARTIIYVSIIGTTSSTPKMVRIRRRLRELGVRQNGETISTVEHIVR